VQRITGRNHHSVGFGVITELSTGIGADCATIGRILKDNGYATSWFGKDHNTPDYQYSVAGVVARNGPEGLAAIKNNHPNMVLSDIKMPGMDGFGLLREI
jgi:arylsulfatase A-like enzyme